MPHKDDYAARAYQRTYYLAHREAKLQYQTEYGANNADRIRGAAKERRKRNADVIKAKRLANRESFNARKRAWHQKNRESQLAAMRRYREEHADEMAAYRATYYATNTEKCCALSRDWHYRNREQNNQRSRQWHKENPIESKALKYKRRRREQEAVHSLTTSEWQAICRYFDYRCLKCGRREPEIKLTIDHVIPLSKDGSTTAANVQPLCARCNTSKGTKSTDYRPSSFLTMSFRTSAYQPGAAEELRMIFPLTTASASL
jgi:5-methylcytosine-specific restriction endonuclease McrA